MDGDVLIALRRLRLGRGGALKVVRKHDGGLLRWQGRCGQCGGYCLSWKLARSIWDPPARRIFGAFST